MTSTLVYGLASLVPAYLAYRVYTKPSTAADSRPLPPGPKPLPIIGNVLDLASTELWLKAQQWATQYGGITYLNIFGLSLVFVNTPEAANDLMERKGALYADRMQMEMVGLSGCDNMVSISSSMKWEFELTGNPHCGVMFSLRFTGRIHTLRPSNASSAPSHAACPRPCECPGLPSAHGDGDPGPAPSHRSDARQVA
jgi:hypothetical protein